MLNEVNSPSYEITPLTMAVLVYHDKKGNTGAWVLEEKEEYYIDIPPSKFIDQACKYYGASLKGRQEGTRNIYGITHKAPISIDPSSGMYFFPTASPVNSNCSWIAHSHIKHVNQLKNKETEVIFRNGRKVSLQVSYGSIMNQIQRTAQFRYLLDNRLNYSKTQLADRVAEPFLKDLE
ncbi:MAG TPA: competence protein ComK [Candidatus Avamphibacillus sp.]|nr:competence protein ComK [Candidatus Avamphibacillus sp.]